MADTGQLALLVHDGIDAWNAWRKEDQGAVPTLEDANLMKVDLAGGNGVGANPKRAKTIHRYKHLAFS